MNTAEILGLIRDPELIAVLKDMAKCNERDIRGQVSFLLRSLLLAEVDRRKREADFQIEVETRRQSILIKHDTLKNRARRQEEQLALQKAKEERRQARLVLAQGKIEEAKKWKGVEFRNGLFYAVRIDAMTGLPTVISKGKQLAEEAALAFDDAHRFEQLAATVKPEDLNFPHITATPNERHAQLGNDLLQTIAHNDAAEYRAGQGSLLDQAARAKPILVARTPPASMADRRARRVPGVKPVEPSKAQPQKAQLQQPRKSK